MLNRGLRPPSLWPILASRGDFLPSVPYFGSRLTEPWSPRKPLVFLSPPPLLFAARLDSQRPGQRRAAPRHPSFGLAWSGLSAIHPVPNFRCRRIRRDQSPRYPPDWRIPVRMAAPAHASFPDAERGRLRGTNRGLG
ncbi:hypothetical protein CIRG_07314 [Coccidioides immitis RMSCC 2394]|uniref:Uncharacterized protein n=1 Tax=Coccidioides immitis RMSCC 2394 TaxID=404692 RepID=A0A0J6YL33_COCIT|nr:hypothetical protein CIRG_07314 [Coccidioides immitis RMSCC 2394]